MDGRTTPSDDVLLERTLAFSGSYTSDDGHVTIRRYRPVPDYSTARFAGPLRPLRPGGADAAGRRAAGRPRRRRAVRGGAPPRRGGLTGPPRGDEPRVRPDADGGRMTPTSDDLPPRGRIGAATWRAGPARDAVLSFVSAVRDGGEYPPVPLERRVAVFDNDGTLWCEKPMPIQLDFILRRLVDMAATDPSLAGRQPWKAAWSGTPLARQRPHRALRR